MHRFSSMVSLLLVTLVVAAALPVHAQECPALVQQAIIASSNLCSAVGRNQVCHGNRQVDAEGRSQQVPLEFFLGDQIDLFSVRSIEAMPYDAANRLWGVAVLQAQVNLPDTLPGQNVTFVMFGDVQLTDDGDSAAAPMEKFRVRTGVSGVQCQEAPTDGLLIQTPEGAGMVTLTVNGVEVSLGSTALIQATPGGLMTVALLEGRSVATLGDESRELAPGWQVQLPLNEALEPAGTLSEPGEFALQTVVCAPLELLPRRPLEVVCNRRLGFVGGPSSVMLRPRGGDDSVSPAVPPEASTDSGQPGASSPPPQPPAQQPPASPPTAPPVAPPPAPPGQSPPQPPSPPPDDDDDD